tara:strand:+ start:1151 stop:1378 length:228 start_codon:yes stop_codon:yes gene_type:complete
MTASISPSCETISINLKDFGITEENSILYDKLSLSPRDPSLIYHMISQNKSDSIFVYDIALKFLLDRRGGYHNVF